MKENSHKVVILNKLSSPYISEAILILKDNDCVTQSKAVEEAERIVLSYIERTSKNGQPVKAVRSHSWKITIFSCICAALVAFLCSFAAFR